MTSAEWFGGKTASPKLISLEDGFVPSAPKEFTTTAPAIVTRAATFNGSGHSPVTAESAAGLQRENEELKLAILTKDAKIRQLEARLAQL